MENSINFNTFLLSHTPPVSSTSQGEWQVGKGQSSSQDLLKLRKDNRKNRKRKCRFAAGKWTLEEQKDYMDFIDKYSILKSWSKEKPEGAKKYSRVCQE